MKPCEERSEGGMCIIDNQTHLHLNVHEASAFWQWLSTLQQNWQAIDRQAQREMLLSQQDLNHGDARETTLPGLHEQGTKVKGLDAASENMTQQALQLFRAYQAEAHLHPLLEDITTYAQG